MPAQESVQEFWFYSGHYKYNYFPWKIYRIGKIIPLLSSLVWTLHFYKCDRNILGTLSQGCPKLICQPFFCQVLIAEHPQVTHSLDFFNVSATQKLLK